jgi:nicotinamidase/pyrazinamidase
VELGGVEQVLWPVHCVAGTPGAAFVRGLDLSRVARVFDKGTDRSVDSYSGFYDNGHRKSTGLGEYLREHGVREVSVAGLATDYCVKATALDAVDLGFATWLVEDACRGVELHPGDVAGALDELRRAGVGLLRLAHVLGDGGWNDPGARAPGSTGVY